MLPEPPDGTIERWAWNYVVTADLAHKLAPPAPPREWEIDGPPRVVPAPGRPPSLVYSTRGIKTTKVGALRDPGRRAELFHTFLHHELQAAELMAWAILAFPRAPPAFRRGLLNICLDEIRHMAMYGHHMARLGVTFGAHTINDWFWKRVPSASSPAHFCAVMGMGFEAGNLDHAVRFERSLQEAGDGEASRIQATVGQEEIPHVAFGAHWFRTLVGAVDFDAWRDHLPPPLSPMVMKGKVLAGDERRRAGLDEAFQARLAAW